MSVWIAVPIGIIGFVFLLLRYNRVKNLKVTSTSLKKINEDELLKLENNLESFPTGGSYQIEGHAYVTDLDVFGSHSLFQGDFEYSGI
ncbi:hypothetical protein [Cyclobacterium plantarum]|uniref:Uncharacterized protein n=1 Tax=Cyclobacterium plantarum TaxID=2716263 RepID=A0ABX0HA31_9BACT|nr:hypothetical protein [Cyclobacterium plantarum]NHE57228.1 hypothetical protein [Cyclobacterium plantarum]